MERRTISRILFAVAVAFAAPAFGAEPVFPAKPIRIVVGFAPGGSADVPARAIAQAARSPLGQEVLVVNKPGASGLIGVNEVVAANPDGYAIGLSGSTAFTRSPLHEWP